MNDIEQLAQWIKGAKNILVFTGAGISTESGIPDFKTTTSEWKYEIPRERAMSVSYRDKYPKKFWPIYKDVFKVKVFEDIQPNTGHLFFAELENLGKEVTIVTQNVDGLHKKAGSSKVYEVHGTLQTAYCPKCGLIHDIQYVRDHDIPRCSRPKGDKTCGFILHPSVVLFEDAIKHYKESFAAVDNADLFITVGTSLNVGPINQLAIKAYHDPYKKNPNMKRVIINRDETILDYCFDLKIRDGIGDTLVKVKELL